MIVHDLILPAAYHLQRLGYLKEISVCGTRVSSLRALKNNAVLKDAFPGQDFTAYPAPPIRPLSSRCRTSFIIG
jgi:hypothetical protein